MNETLRKMLACLVAVLCCSQLVTAGDENCPGISALVDNRMLVRTLPELDAAQALADFIKAYEANPDNGTITGELDSIAEHELFLLEYEAPPGTNFDALELRLKSDFTAFIQYAELLYVNDAPEGGSGSTYVDSFNTNPSTFGGQYFAFDLGVPVAHLESTGAGVVVAVLDTGVDGSHPELTDRVLADGYNFIKHTTNTTESTGDGSDTDGDGLTDEMLGHGTYVAGLIAMTAPNAKILPVCVLDDDGNGDMWTLCKGLVYAIERGVEVINLSLRSTYDSQAIEDLIDFAADRGIATVAAAGNYDCNRREYPAAKSTAFGVVALDDNDIKADFSNYNDKFFISAPGATVYIGDEPDADRAIISTIPGGGYAAWEGTSMATPIVAGTVALIRAQHPEWPAELNTVYLMKAVLEASATDIYDVNPQYNDEELGVGQVHTLNAVLESPPAPTLGDLNNNGAVDVNDLLSTLEQWGDVHTSADLDGSGAVDIVDILIILANWTG